MLLGDDSLPPSLEFSGLTHPFKISVVGIEMLLLDTEMGEESPPSLLPSLLLASHITYVSWLRHLLFLFLFI